MNKDNSVYEQESRSPFAPGYEPVPYDTEDIQNYINGAKVEYASEVKPWGMIHIKFADRFLRFNELKWYAKQHGLYVNHITAVHNPEWPDCPGLDVMFYRGEDPSED